MLIAAHRPRMLRIAARYADQWDTFAAIPGAATEGVEADDRRADRSARRGVPRDRPRSGRDPPLDLGDAARSLARPTRTSIRRARHRALGFTDFTTVLPAPEHAAVLANVASEVIPAIRSGLLT